MLPRMERWQAYPLDLIRNPVAHTTDGPGHHSDHTQPSSSHGTQASGHHTQPSSSYGTQASGPGLQHPGYPATIAVLRIAIRTGRVAHLGR